jgi:DNA-binding SARP family transcriptional activator
MHKLYLLGGINLRNEAGKPDVERALTQSKAVAVLAYLALSPLDRFQRRDRIVGLLWPELDQERARAALRKALQLLRGALDDATVVARGDEELTVDRNLLWCDAVAFRQACDDNELATALDLYEGNLMPGFYIPNCTDFDFWLEEERRDLGERAAAAAWALAQHLEEVDKATLAAQWARRAVRYAGTDERVLRRTMTMLDRLGDRVGALKLYGDFAARMRKELETEVSAETKALARGMREVASS